VDEHGRGGAGSPNEHGGARAGTVDMAGAQDAGTGDGVMRGARMGNTVLGLGMRPLTFITGYIATGLLALTLLLGPANLVLRRRNPVSSTCAVTWACGRRSLA
jgi:hypothetical protein